MDLEKVILSDVTQIHHMLLLMGISYLQISNAVYPQKQEREKTAGMGESRWDWEGKSRIKVIWCEKWKNGEGAPAGDEKGNSIQTVKERRKTNNTQLVW